MKTANCKEKSPQAHSKRKSFFSPSFRRAKIHKIRTQPFQNIILNHTQYEVKSIDDSVKIKKKGC